MGRTALLTSKRCILYIYSTNIGTPRFFSIQNAVCFIMLTCLVPVLFTFYIQGVLKLNNSGSKGLMSVIFVCRRKVSGDWIWLLASVQIVLCPWLNACVLLHAIQTDNYLWGSIIEYVAKHKEQDLSSEADSCSVHQALWCDLRNPIVSHRVRKLSQLCCIFLF